MSEEVECPECGEEYTSLGNHWALSSCGYPELSQKQEEIITGILMGDGCIDDGDKNPNLTIETITEEYLSYLDSKFGVIGTGVRFSMSAEESAERNRESGFSQNAQSENYSDVYSWNTRNHPELHQFAEWYDTGKKVWPDNIELTPTILKHWYCGDGTWSNTGSRNCILIAMSNEFDGTEKVDKMFENAGLPTPTYNKYEHCDGFDSCIARFTVEDSKKLWEYMGEPLPGFEYKWPEEFR